MSSSHIPVIPASDWLIIDLRDQSAGLFILAYDPINIRETMPKEFEAKGKQAKILLSVVSINAYYFGC